MCTVTIIDSVYTNDCVSHCKSIQIFKFADDTTFLGLITNNNKSDFRREVSTLFEWSCTHNLNLYVLKTKEMVRTLKMFNDLNFSGLPSMQH